MARFDKHMNFLKEQAIASICRSGLHRVTDNLIGLLRSSIRLSTHAVAEQSLEIGASKIGGTPDLSPEMGWPEYQGMPLPFYAQIRCADLIASDQDSVLPHRGWLYFFYDPEAEDEDKRHRSLKKVPYPPKSWRVLYYGGEVSQLERTVTPASLSEWNRYGCCAVTFSPEIQLPEHGSGWLRHLGLSYSTYEVEEELSQYRELTDQLRSLSVSDSLDGIRMLGYPDEMGDGMEDRCEEYSLVLGWHNQRSTEADTEWILLLQIDVNEAEFHGATKMGRGDWFAIYFWIRRDALARRDFEQVWLTFNAD